MPRPTTNLTKASPAEHGRSPHFARRTRLPPRPPWEPPDGCLLDLSTTILENSRAIIYVKDLQGRYLFVNRRFEDVLGIDAEEIVGRSDFNVHSPEVARRLRANDARVIRAGKAEEIEETVMIAGSDRPSYYVSVKEPLFNGDGRPFALCGISTDITELRRTEEILQLEKLRYRSLVEATAAIVWDTPPSGEFESEQPGWTEFTGQTFEQLRGWGWLDAIHPDDHEKTTRVWTFAVENRTPYTLEHRVRRHDGVYRDMAARGVPIPAPDGSIREWMGVHIDVSEQNTTRAALWESRERLAAALSASGTGTYLWDLETDAMEWDDQLRELVGVPPDYEPTGQTILALLHPDDRPLLAQALEEAKTGASHPPTEYRVLRPDGSVRWLRVQGRIFHDAAGRPSHSIGGCVDVTDLKRAEERLSHRANHDMLTGMPNRAMLQSTMEDRVATGSRFAFLLLDLDRFKEINDTFGHGYGDAVLKELRPRLGALVQGRGLVARLGGDEFGILLDDAGMENAVATARAIQTDLMRPIFAQGRALEVGASVGVTLYPDQGSDVASIMRTADVAMYEAKRMRAGWAIYQAEQERTCARSLTMIGELRQAIAEDQLRLHYQPKVDLRAMVDVGVEALVRWEHPRHGLLAPGEFIPVAEETGLIHPLSLWVLDRALRDRRTWADSGVEIDVAVNLAPDSLQDPSLDLIIADMLARHGTQPRRLTIEVTETAMMRNPARARSLLGRLHDTGVQISIDDFGTGYSSLAYLKELPVDEVKVDRSFVKDAASSRRDACIARAVIDLGHNLDLRVVAEGVEDDETVELLRGWGCDLGQGWLLGRPTPADTYLRDRRALIPGRPWIRETDTPGKNAG